MPIGQRTSVQDYSPLPRIDTLGKEKTYIIAMFHNTMRMGHNWEMERLIHVQRQLRHLQIKSKKDPCTSISRCIQPKVHHSILYLS